MICMVNQVSKQFLEEAEDSGLQMDPIQLSEDQKVDVKDDTLLQNESAEKSVKVIRTKSPTTMIDGVECIVLI